MFRYLLVVECELHRYCVEGCILTGIAGVFARFGPLTKEIHTFYLAKEIIHHLTCCRRIVGTLGEVVCPRFDEGGGDLGRDSGRVKQGGLTEIEIVDYHGFLSSPDSIAKEISSSSAALTLSVVTFRCGFVLVCRACLHSFFIDCQSTRELRITRILRDAVI